MDFDLQAEGADAVFNPVSGSLLVKGRSADGTPSCCPKHLDQVTFKWEGGRFVQQRFKRTLLAKR
jgi:hypothetical protein